MSMLSGPIAFNAASNAVSAKVPGRSIKPSFVMAGFMPGIHVLTALKTWMAGTFGVKTRFALLPGHDLSLSHGPLQR
jgi:hypothetical protein